MKWDKLQMRSREFIRAACNKLKRESSATDFHLNRIANEIEKSFRIDTILPSMIAFLALIFSIYAAQQTYSFFLKERLDRRGSIVCKAYIGKKDLSIHNVKKMYGLLPQNGSDSRQLYNCETKSDFMNCTLFLVWESDKDSSVNLSDVEDKLDSFVYTVKIAPSVGGRHFVYETKEGDIDFVIVEPPYAFLPITTKEVDAVVTETISKLEGDGKFDLYIVETRKENRGSENNRSGNNFYGYID
ncbi:hypothetical protein [Maridesulfovibrio hydrothermalis]|uniref:Uncharacterized protein n=1 Tax=Maridesulfovibrio hydrothermalis AM13 = DSM 14728 TaxID=1121451 RepID=L0RAH0_9BACT|nr:hypothetical protein [Maridesulfovibrio hydrothermalis]CCO23754.1 protein of unknown function [Maridesulfovibrio hydrothermalis AM13 = DSM 14728]